MFQEVAVGGEVAIEVRRGYQLRNGDEFPQFIGTNKAGPEQGMY